MNVETTGQANTPELPSQKCTGCGHEFPPETPDPFWCPQCGKLWSNHEGWEVPKPILKPGEPPPVELTATERSRYRLAFVILLVGTPVAMLGMVMMSVAKWQWLPKIIRDLGSFTYGIIPALGTIVMGCLTAGFCLTRLRNTGGPGWNTAIGALWYAILIFFAYLLIAFVGCSMLRTGIR